ncbi:MAG: IS66 family transposase [Verrucomicrobia bacterium]|nr:IS66 family transposase [Verrucomicrobiota bacterium]
MDYNSAVGSAVLCAPRLPVSIVAYGAQRTASPTCNLSSVPTSHQYSPPAFSWAGSTMLGNAPRWSLLQRNKDAHSWREQPAWMQRQFDDKLVEPNSGLGEAIGYMLRHWQPLTLFLRQPGAPLDNSICERALKMAILHRKNSLSYKTLNGARTGDLFMSLIHTCRLNGVNPFDYLLAIATHAEAVKLIPKAWLPWNYPKSAASLDTS